MHSFLYFIVRVGNGILAIVMLAAFSRMLSPEEYGIYAIGMATATLASGILYQWLNSAVSRFTPIYHKDSRIFIILVARGFWASTIAAVFISLGVLAFQNILSVEPALIGVLLLIVVGLGYHTISLQMANAQSDPLRYGMITWSKSVVALIVSLLFISSGGGGQSALLGLLAGLIFSAIAFPQKALMRIKPVIKETGLSDDMLRFGLPVTLNFIALIIVDVADRFIIAKLLGFSYVATYAVAYDLVQQMVGAFMNALFLAALPKILQTFEDGRGKSSHFYLYSLGTKIVFLGLPFSVGLGVLASDITEVFLGIKYHQDAVIIIPWLAAAIFLAGFKSFFLDVVFQIHQATKYIAYISVLMASVNIVLNIVLLPRYGLIAAAWATLIAFLVGVIASWTLGKSLYVLPNLVKVILKSAVASSFMALFLCFLPSAPTFMLLFCKVILGVIIYYLISWTLDVAGCRKLFKV